MVPKLKTVANDFLQMIREDILELALASLPSDNIAVAEDILRRSKSAWASFPSWIQDTQHRRQREGLQTHISNEVCEGKSRKGDLVVCHLLKILAGITQFQIQ